MIIKGYGAGAEVTAAGVFADLMRVVNEPNGAVAWKGTNDYSKSLRNHLSGKQLFISLETAHPAKFSKEIHQILNFEPRLPSSL